MKRQFYGSNDEIKIQYDAYVSPDVVAYFASLATGEWPEERPSEFDEIEKNLTTVQRPGMGDRKEWLLTYRGQDYRISAITNGLGFWGTAYTIMQINNTVRRLR